MGFQGLMVASNLASSAGGIVQGFSQQNAANEESKLIDRQAKIARQEAIRAAQQKARDVRQFQGKQSIKYLASGVRLQGTPIQMLEETRKLGQEEVNAILARGIEQERLLKAKANQTKRAGRAAFLGSIVGAGTNALGSFAAFNRLSTNSPSTGTSIRTSPYATPLDPVASFNGALPVASPYGSSTFNIDTLR